MNLRKGGLLVAAASLACLACTEDRTFGPRDPIPGSGELGGPDGEAPRCAGCHGTEAPWAPPPDTRGHEEESYRGVGSHRAHLGAILGRKVACGECHVVPATVDAAGHLDSALPAEVAFSGIGTSDGLEPVAEAAGPAPEDVVTCRNVYCHGASLDGGSRTSPAWNAEEPGRFRVCGACHGMPPARTRGGALHPASETCSNCHGAVVRPDGTFRDASLHVNGIVEVESGGACNSCHGSGTNAAPPVDTAGRSGTGEVTVGAHQSHLRATLGKAVACEACHVVPGTVDAAGHLDGSPEAEVVFGGLSVTDGAAPAWDRVTATCGGSYCHGATLDGGSLTAPKWTVVDGSQKACGTCHGAPPPSPHPQSGSCETCHAPTAGPGGTIANAATHIDGQVQVVGGACNSCHGSGTNAAPPVDTAGRSGTGEVTVGAHQSHLRATLGKAVACEACHVVPGTVDAAGHLDGSPEAEVVFGGLSVTDGAAPAWDRVTATCGGSYCHGATLDGGSLTAPKWTVVDGSQKACGTCHGAPPPSPHPASPICGTCHQDATLQGGIADASRHIDGNLDVRSDYACNACHGGVDNPAPPRDLDGGDQTTRVTVGAHQAHLGAPSAIANALACGDCHQVPATLEAAGHIDTLRPAEVEFGPLARTDGANPQWNRASGTCSGTYCHGATLNAGGTATAPLWTRVDGSQDACTSCHGMSPPTGRHPGVFQKHASITDCNQCHNGVANAAGTAIVAPALHIDGTVRVQLKLAGTWDPATRTCDPACHGAETWR